MDNKGASGSRGGIQLLTLLEQGSLEPMVCLHGGGLKEDIILRAQDAHDLGAAMIATAEVARGDRDLWIIFREEVELGEKEIADMMSFIRDRRNMEDRGAASDSAGES